MKPQIQEDNKSQHPQMGLPGFMGAIGIGAISLSTIIIRRKKK